VATLESYRQRYRPVAVAEGMAAPFDGEGRLNIIEDHIGTGSTDYWGISFSRSSCEQEPMAADEFDRKILLLQGCWAFFDKVAASVSAELLKGPRGGGRDHDRVIRHTIRTESEEFARSARPPRPRGDIRRTSGRCHSTRRRLSGTQ
jgi:hypothetical protein